MTEDQHRPGEPSGQRPGQPVGEQPEQPFGQPPERTDDGGGPGDLDPAATESFGDPRVDAAVVRTDGLDARPVGEHVEVFDDVHRCLRDALDDPAEDA